MNKIVVKDWTHTCADGCCYDYGVDVFLNDEKLVETNDSSPHDVLLLL
jgi:hypothetical protein